MDRKIDFYFITKPGCGICNMMKPAFAKIMEERQNWNFHRYTVGEDQAVEKIMQELPDPDGKLPMFCLYIDDIAYALLTGGHRYKDIIRIFDEVIQNVNSRSS